jgi:hypothetical protein
MGYDASPADGDHAMHVHAIHVGRLSLDPLLRLIDAATASLQRLRHRLEAPVEEEAAVGGGRIAPEAHVEPAAVATPKPSRLRRFAIVAVLLSCAGALGMAFSYKLLSKSLRTSDAVVETLRDEIAQLEKESARLLQEKSKYQKQVYEHEKEIRVLRQEVDASRAETEELHGQVSALKSSRGGAPAQGTAVAANSGKQQAPQKAGTCTAGGANAAANLGRCVEEFNRK